MSTNTAISVKADVFVGNHAYDDQGPIFYISQTGFHVAFYVEPGSNSETFRAVADKIERQGAQFVAAARAEADRLERLQAMQDAANDGFIDNYDPDTDAAGADDYLSDVTS